MTFKFFDESSNNYHPNDEPFTVDAFKMALDAGFQGVIIKSSEGIKYENPYCKGDAINAHTAGLHVGYYHFSRPSQSDGASQAEFAHSITKDLPRDMGISDDFEILEGLSWAEAETWNEEFLEFLSSLNIGSPLYSNEDFLQNMPKAPFNHKLWLAAPGSHQPRRTVWAWQNTWSLIVPGIGLCDGDIYYGVE